MRSLVPSLKLIEPCPDHAPPSASSGLCALAGEPKASAATTAVSVKMPVTGFNMFMILSAWPQHKDIVFASPRTQRPACNGVPLTLSHQHIFELPRIAGVDVLGEQAGTAGYRRPV